MSKPITPVRYTMRPYAIEAIQWTDDVDPEEIARWCGGRYDSTTRAEYLTVPRLDEDPVAKKGEWIFRDEDGRFNILDDKKFTETYELTIAEDDSAGINCCGHEGKEADFVTLDETRGNVPDDLTITTVGQLRTLEQDGAAVIDCDGDTWRWDESYKMWCWDGLRYSSANLVGLSPLRIIHFPVRDIAAKRAARELREIAAKLKWRQERIGSDTDALNMGFESGLYTAELMVRDRASEIEQEARS